jgi:hypothetical protein
MPQELRDLLAWLPLLGLTAPFIIYYLTIRRQRKGLSYEVISAAPVVNVRPEMSSRVKVYLDDQLIRDVHVVIVNIRNSGNVPIKSEDFESPISISFGESSRVIETSCEKADPGDVTPALEQEEGGVLISPLLLNPGDYIRLRALVIQKYIQMTVSARIAGVKRVTEIPLDVRGDSRRSKIMLLVGTICVTISAYFVLIEEAIQRLS